MQVRQSLLPHDLQYCLDGAAECCGITAAAEIAIRLYGEADRLDAIWNAKLPDEVGVRRYRGLRDREIEIERYGAEIIRQLPGPRRTAIIERGLLSLTHDIVTKAEWLSDAFYEDMTKGGNLRPFLLRIRVGRDMLPTRRMARRLRSFKAIRRYVRSEGDLRKQRTLFEILASIPPGGPATDEDRQAIFSDLDGQMDAHRRAQRQAIENAAFRARFENNAAAEVDRVLVKLRPQFARKMRQERRTIRRAVKRAAMLAAAMLGASVVSAFARGEPVLLRGPDVSISAQLTGRIGDKGHGALRVGVQDLEGTRLAGVCVYQDAPALDQLISLAMHVQSGCVSDVLSTGNLYAIEPAGDAHALIAAHRKARPQIAVNVADMVDGAWDRRRWNRHVIQYQRQAYDAGKTAFGQEMHPVFEDIIANVIFGPASAIWRRHRESLTPERRA